MKKKLVLVEFCPKLFRILSTSPGGGGVAIGQNIYPWLRSETTKIFIGPLLNIIKMLTKDNG